jgi:hypothetical protein
LKNSYLKKLNHFYINQALPTFAQQLNGMIKMKKIYQSSLFILMIAAFLFSCKKDISEIGVNVVGDDPLEVIYVDTFSIVAHSELVDSMRTDELSSHLLGAYIDPVFGTLNASIYSQFRLEAGNEDFDFPDGSICDSVVLYLAYADNEVYGDTNYQHQISIYEVGDQIYRDSSYYHFQNLRTKNEVLAELNFVPSFDSIDYNDIVGDDTIESGRKIAPISVHLNQNFGERLIEYGPEVYESNETFLAELAGLYITTLDQNLPSSEGSLVNIDFLSDDTKITLYYTYTLENDDGNDTTYHEEFDLICNSNTARFGNYNHYDYYNASPEFRSQVIDGDTTLGEEMVYLQGLAGVRTIISFPHIRKMDNYYNYAVNEAKLFLWDVNDASSDLQAIEALSLSQQVQLTDSSYVYYTIPDASSGDNYFNGEYNGTDRNYFFRITQFIQDLIQGYTVDSKLRVEIIGGAVNANRSVLGGYNSIDETKNLKLQLIYTKIDSDE